MSPSLAAWCHVLDALRRLDLHGGEHRQHPADCLAGAAAQAVKAGQGADLASAFCWDASRSQATP